MERVEVIKTRDGKLFENLTEADIHNAELEMKEVANVFVTKHCTYNMDSNMVFDIIMDNIDDIIKLGEYAQTLKNKKDILGNPPPPPPQP
jgi:hypothetical protein